MGGFTGLDLPSDARREEKRKSIRQSGNRMSAPRTTVATYRHSEPTRRPVQTFDSGTTVVPPGSQNLMKETEVRTRLSAVIEEDALPASISPIKPATKSSPFDDTSDQLRHIREQQEEQEKAERARKREAEKLEKERQRQEEAERRKSEEANRRLRENNQRMAELQQKAKSIADPDDYEWDFNKGRVTPGHEADRIKFRRTSDWSSTDALKMMNTRSYFQGGFPDSEGVRERVVDWFKATFPETPKGWEDSEWSRGFSSQPEDRRKVDEELDRPTGCTGSPASARPTDSLHAAHGRRRTAE
ncbi:hypothetical protein [Magnetospira sp. QH-2]|uniref:hypothetical protein n=1 Tax=Magnetospira sp. (strain QH-2) TaxID=1288970 RepID=UPI0003E811BA|nr:hypothetical protein [Magnetospira sp. QH-2]CCQ74225.1 Protein of unknown function [Magnetospira sp. QH-2]